MPRSPMHLLLLAVAVGVLALLVQYGVLTVAFGKLGLSAEAAYLLLVTTLAGSLLNMPLFTIDSENTGEAPAARLPPWLRLQTVGLPGKTLIAVNVGGCVVPVAFCIYLFSDSSVSMGETLLSVLAVSLIAHLFSRPIRGMGIGMPILIAPLAAAAIAVSVGEEQTSAPLAYIGGTLGVLIGADLLRLKDIRKLGAPVASIGGAGSFDGIFLTGILAVLLA